MLIGIYSHLYTSNATTSTLIGISQTEEVLVHIGSLVVVFVLLLHSIAYLLILQSIGITKLIFGSVGPK